MESIVHWLSAICEWSPARPRYGQTPSFKRLITLLVAGGALALAGCAIVDQYSGRATVYNLESEVTHDQGLLLNIVRASLRRPRQFTIVQKITGTASAEGAASLTFPFGPHIGSTANSGLFSAGANGGPEFEVAPLETNEFYGGILQPISAQLFDLYMHSEFPRDLLLNLFVEKIIMRRTDGVCAYSHLLQCEIVFQNYPGTDMQLELFQALAGYLINLGLSTEKIETPKKKKPSKSKKKDGSSGDSGGDDDDDSGDDSSDDGGSPKVQPYSFCFAPREMRYAVAVSRNSVCGNRSAPAALRDSRLGRRATLTDVGISREFAALLTRIVERNRSPLGTPPERDQAFPFRYIAGFAGRGVTLSIYTRSTETLIFYLGEVVRRQYHPDIEGQAPRTVMIKTGPPFNPFDEEPCPLRDPPPACKPLFVLEENAPPSLSSPFSVVYEGVRYSIPAAADAGYTYNTAAGGSYTVLTVLRQLLILNTKAKSLPATNVLTNRQ